MIAELKLLQGTTAWFEMAGTLMREAASGAGLAANLNVSFLERYTDGIELSEGLVQGLRFDVVGGEQSFRIGVGRSERADIVVELPAAAARRLNTLYSSDPAYRSARENLVADGEMYVAGDPGRLGAWLDAVHDPIVDRTS